MVLRARWLLPVLFVLASCIPAPPIKPNLPTPPGEGATAAQMAAFQTAMDSYQKQLAVYKEEAVKYNAVIERYASALEKGQAIGPVAQIVGATGPYGELIAAIISPLLLLGGAKGAAALRRKKVPVPE